MQNSQIYHGKEREKFSRNFKDFKDLLKQITPLSVICLNLPISFFNFLLKIPFKFQIEIL